MSKRLSARRCTQAITADVDMGAYDRKVLVLSATVRDGYCTSPRSGKSFSEVILRHAARPFEPGVRYTEKEVSETLARYSDDTATLRRDMVAHGVIAPKAEGAALAAGVAGRRDEVAREPGRVVSLDKQHAWLYISK